MASLLSILLPLVGIMAVFAALSGLQIAGERMQRRQQPFARAFGKALATTAAIAIGILSIAGAVGVGYLLLQPGAPEPTACARFCD